MGALTVFIFKLKKKTIWIMLSVFVLLASSIVTLILYEDLPASDAGEECTDSSQCKSYCKAPEVAQVGEKVVGKCEKSKHPNCWSPVHDGIFTGEFCA